MKVAGEKFDEDIIGVTDTDEVSGVEIILASSHVRDILCSPTPLQITFI